MAHRKQPDSSRADVVNRRQALGKLAAGGAVAWVSPTVLSRAAFAQASSADESFFNASTWKSVGHKGTILTSSDAARWTSEVSGVTKELKGVAYGNETWVATGHEGTILRHSDDGWESITVAGVEGTVGAVAYGNGTWVAVGNNATVLTSSDARHWSSHSVGRRDLRGVAYGNGTWVVVGDDATVHTRSDASDWSSLSVGPRDLRGVAYENGTWVVVGAKGVIFTSSDASRWSPEESGTDKNLNSVHYGNRRFIAVGQSGTFRARVDGVDGPWSDPTSVTETSVTEKNLRAVHYGNRTWTVVGEDGTILTSANNGADWGQRVVTEVTLIGVHHANA